MEKPLDLRIQKTYLSLHNAFTELLSNNYFEDITVNELCDAAMIRRTTFYKHFSDKYDYFEFYLNELMETQSKTVSLDTLYHNPIEFAEKRLFEHLTFMREHRQLIQHFKNSKLTSFFAQCIEKQLKEELYTLFIQYEKLTPSPQLDFVTSIYAGALLSVVTWWIENPDVLSDKDIAELLVKSLVFGQHPLK